MGSHRICQDELFILFQETPRSDAQHVGVLVHCSGFLLGSFGVWILGLHCALPLFLRCAIL